MKKRHQTLTAEQLTPGDVFYKVGDKQKTALKMIAPNGAELQYCKALDKTERLTKNIIKEYTMVVYLRTIN